jgi:hypothetical protein
MKTKTLFRMALVLVLTATTSNVFAWHLAYATDAKGIPSYGTLPTLINAIKQGQNVRISQENSWWSCDQVTVAANNSVVMCANTNHISLNTAVSGTDFGFKLDAYHW